MTTQDPLNEEKKILDYFRENFTTNPKKLKQMARRIAPQCAPFIQNGLITSIVLAKDPVKYLKKAFQQLDEMKDVIESLIASGAHGMIIIKDTIYPIEVKTVKNWLKEGDRWDPEQELLMQHDFCNKWMEEHNKGYFHGKVVLFKQFGFSGIPREIEMRCVKDTTGLQRYPGTNYYTSED